MRSPVLTASTAPDGRAPLADLPMKLCVVTQTTVVLTALRERPGIVGGIWQDESRSLALRLSDLSGLGAEDRSGDRRRDRRRHRHPRRRHPAPGHPTAAAGNFGYR